MPAPTAVRREQSSPELESSSHDGRALEEQGARMDTSEEEASTLTVTNMLGDGDEDCVSSSSPSHKISNGVMSSSRKIPIPPHRFAPLKTSWPRMYPPIVEHLHLDVKMHLKPKARAVEIRTNKETVDPGALQKGEDFVKAFTLGFEIEDAIALLRLDDLYIETFEIKDVKTLQGEHLARAIGRIAGKDGRTKFAIENASRTRIVLADQKIHILGQFKNIGVAREAIVDLIRGSPPSKVYGNLRTVSARMKERW